ncbi:MAG TPA: ATP-binding protein [Balneolaceae bacterium]|nr:ATP-binding protein [Balneolaceae bacterium]
MEDLKQKNYQQVIADLQASLGWMDLVLDNIGEGILVLDDGLKVSFANDAIAEMTGKSSITLLGMPIWEALILNKGEKRLEKNDFQQVLNDKSLESLDGRYALQGKNEFTVSVTTSFIPKVNQIAFIVRDITQRLNDEQALLDERIARMREQIGRKQAEDDRQLLQSIIDGTFAIIYLKDAESRYMVVNRRFEEIFGLEKDEVKGKTDFDLFPKETAEILCKNDQKVLETGQTIRSEEAITLQNDRRHYLSVKYPLLGSGDTRYKLCGVLTDITVRKKLEESKNDFIRMVHHELNTPLTVMKLFLKTIRRNLETGKSEEALSDFSKIEDQLEQVSMLTDDLLDVTMMEQAEFQIRKEQFNLTELVKNAIGNEQAKTDKHAIRLHGKPAEYQLLADKQRIGQVMRNLLSNAVKYSPKGGDVNVRLKRDSNYITVSVQDFGIGVPEEKKEIIFDKFNRGSIPESDFSGLGIGLYIASEIIKHHGGHIDVKSEEGKGSTFSFQLPL